MNEALTLEIEARLHRHRLAGLEPLLADGFLMPHYDGLSIANVPATVAMMLGAPFPDLAPPLPQELWADLAEGVRRIVLVLLDAVGYRAFLQALDDDGSLVFHRLVEAGRLIPLTSTFPSATMAALTTLWTGQPPAVHGYLGTKLWLYEQGAVGDMIRLSPAATKVPGLLLQWGLKLDHFVPVPGLGQRLQERGIVTHSLTYVGYLEGGLNELFLRGVADSVGYFHATDMWVDLRQMLAAHQDAPLFLNVYWAGPDSIGHLYGPDSPQWEAELRSLSWVLERELLRDLSLSERAGTLLILMADHGQVSTPPEAIVWMEDHPELEEMLLIPPTGEARAAYLHARQGAVEEVRAYLQERLADQFVVVEAPQALEAGLFGRGNGSEGWARGVPRRIGDLLALAQGGAQLMVKRREEEPHLLRGHHGSLTPEEMLVPFLMVRLEAL